MLYITSGRRHPGSSSTWSNYQSLSGTVRANTSPEVDRNSDGRLEVFVIGTDNALHHKWQTLPGSTLQVGQLGHH